VYSRADLSRTVVFVVALSVTAAATAALASEFRAADTQNEDYPTVQALRYMGSLIAERSNGRHEIKVFHSHQLCAEILDNFEPYGFVGLAFFDSGARSIYNSVRPVRSLADLKGLRIRVQQSEQTSEIIRSLGAEPVELPYGKVLTGLATKLIDGAENNWPSFVTTNHYNYAGYYMLTEHTMSPEVLVMSQKAWATLSTEDKKIFREAALRSSQFMRERWHDLEDQSRKRAETSGVTIVTDFDRKPFEQAMTGIYARAQGDPAAAQLIERIRKAE
jgi:TRAP-type C4-dicarboxylate transport system substrate-binding protein